ncbi:tetratricopeptide repeat protein [Sphingobium chlorophenolicum]|uniref:Sel1 domain protein repeat-containing protein n=1 Tax=Sphingobium chlorophenolicum TaxID=46429 RepID=A0A081RFG4_SPHCR|nr:tetratricopeptide repeat protein [Sphingobium chlorophenolicum]KEQ53937.1 Sel1 domain protein repeat-containing protein [Sphingobium chlorophenolicum]
MTAPVPPSLAQLSAMGADTLAARLAEPGTDRVELIRVAAEGGVAQAQIVLGQMLLDGVELPADPRAAFGWFNRAAASHDMFALNMVGRCYELGWGVAVDPDRATECYRVAAGRGLAEAVYNYATQLALKGDHEAALDWYRRAADDPGLIGAKAANYIGSFHEDGWAVAVDRAQAFRHYRIAAEGGDFRGQFNLARLLAEDGATEEALRWLRRVRETATPAFMEKAADHLRQSSLRQVGLAALLGQESPTC